MWPRIFPKDREAGSGLNAYSSSGIFSAARSIRDLLLDHFGIASDRFQIEHLRQCGAVDEHDASNQSHSPEPITSAFESR
jgi:hypothetical protein